MAASGATLRTSTYVRWHGRLQTSYSMNIPVNHEPGGSQAGHCRDLRIAICPASGWPRSEWRLGSGRQDVIANVIDEKSRTALTLGECFCEIIRRRGWEDSSAVSPRSAVSTDPTTSRSARICESTARPPCYSPKAATATAIQRTSRKGQRSCLIPTAFLER